MGSKQTSRQQMLFSLPGDYAIADTATPYEKTANPNRFWKIISHAILIILNVSIEPLSLLPHTRYLPVSNLGQGTTNLMIFR